MELSLQDIVIRLLAATLLSGIIGIEREMHHKPAGIRTNALIGLGSAVMTLSGMLVASQWPGSDPTRIASVVVQGIGFIGAGAIMQASGGTVRGLTTAAGMWVVAGVGIACGFGFYEVAILAAILALVLLAIFGPIDYRLMGSDTEDRPVLFGKPRKKK